MNDKKEYPMPALTDSDRVELIKYLTAYIEDRCIIMHIRDILRMDRKRNEIAMAALMGEKHRVPAIDGHGNECELELYTAPPVPALKVVEFKDCDIGAVQHMSGGSEDYCNGFVDGIQHAISLMKENGIEVKE